MAKERVLNIFDALNRLSRKDRAYYNSLSEEEQKELLPVVLMRWLSGTSNAQQVYLLNEVVNPFVFDLYKHKPLLINLLIACSSGKGGRYSWLKTKSKKGSSATLAARVIQQAYGYSAADAADALKVFTEEDIVRLAEEIGYQQDDLTKLKKELKAYYDV